MVVLNTYRFTLTNNTKEEQTLSRFNNEADLMDVINEYLNYIFKNIVSYYDTQGKKRAFTLSAPPKIEYTTRTISGYFDSAFSGERIKIKEDITNELNYSVSRKELLSREFFFLIYIPLNSKYGYMAVQQKTNHGVKTIFSNKLNQFFRKKGFMDYYVNLNPASSYNYLMKMFDYGELREIRLINNNIGNTTSEQLGNHVPLLYSGKSERVVKLNRNQNTDFLKLVLKKLFKEELDIDSKIIIDGIKEEFDEVSFRIILNGATKTFYSKSRHKIRSNVDVSSEVKFVNGEPTRESLNKTAMKLINTIINVNNDNDDIAA